MFIMLSKMSIFRRAFKYLLLSILSSLLIISCSNPNGDSVNNQEAIAPDQQSTGCRIVQHHLGETKVCGQPQKIVTLDPHTLDLLLALDKQPAGYADITNFNRGEVFDNPAQQIFYLGDRITTKPVNLGNSNKPSFEKLTALKPDLIIGEASRNESNYELLSKIAPTLLLGNRTASGQWQQSIQAIAEALEDKQLAEKAISNYEKLVADARADLTPVISNNPQLLLLTTNRLSEGIRLFNHQTYLGTLMEEIGFQLVTKNSNDREQLNSLSIETLPQFDNADIIMVLGYNLDTEALQQLPKNDELIKQLENQQLKTVRQNWGNNAIAQTMQASQEDRVYFMTAYLWLGFNGPIGTELILEQLRDILL